MNSTYPKMMSVLKRCRYLGNQTGIVRREIEGARQKLMRIEGNSGKSLFQLGDIKKQIDQIRGKKISFESELEEITQKFERIKGLISSFQ